MNVRRSEDRQLRDRPMMDALEPTTLAGVMNELGRRGFTEHFTVAQGRLRAATRGTTFPADQVVVTEYHRFEGVSDPDDMSILYALETRNGLRGTLADAFGVYADPAVGAFMHDVRPHAGPQGPVGAAPGAGAPQG